MNKIVLGLALITIAVLIVSLSGCVNNKATNIDDSETQLSQDMNGLEDIQTINTDEIGADLEVITGTESSLDTLDTYLNSTISGLDDLDTILSEDDTNTALLN